MEGKKILNFYWKKLKKLILDALLLQGESIIKILLKIPVLGNDPIKSIDHFVTFPLSLLGNQFTYEKFIDDDHSSITVDISTCFFHDFFHQKERKFLASVACSWYHTWGKYVDVDKHQVRFSRVSCMCNGEKKCSFVFRRMERFTDLKVAPEIV